MANGAEAVANGELKMGLGRLPKAQLRPKGYIMPAARRQLRMDKPPRSLTHGGPWPHANPGRRQQVLKERADPTGRLPDPLNQDFSR